MKKILGIFYDEKEQVFQLHTTNTTYAIGIVDNKYVGHIYYGKKIHGNDIKYALRYEEHPKVPSINLREKNTFLDTFPMEYPEYGTGDYREAALHIRTEQGHIASESHYKTHFIMKGKPSLEGLPHSFGSVEQCETLCIICEDPVLNIEVHLYYTVFFDVDVITRSVQIKNSGTKTVYLEKVYSASIDIEDQGFQMLSLHGSWARERTIQVNPIGYGRQNVASFRGTSSHQEHPFFALVSNGKNQDFGDVYAMNFLYSGNFKGQVEKDQFDMIRMSMGIHPDGFVWKLIPEEVFVAPEVVLVYSDEGLGKMTRTYHDFYRMHLIRGSYKDKKRPILINNWEATYFDFDGEKLLEIASEAKQLGIELFVLDDGWFGNRNSDDSSLGDWVVNERKLGCSLKELVTKVKQLGMKFGLWVEPEMISPNSDLFRAHPEWAIQIPNREITQSRAQYVLDLSRKDVIDYLYKVLFQLIQENQIDYIKWDMNRQLTTIGSYWLEKERQGELYHRYLLGVYELQEKLTKDFPHLLLENCSGGGARFDGGMLYYSPQIWCSDDTDAIERLIIQEGTSLIYPLSTIGSHVSICPNHTVGRNTPLETRGHVALFGTFGYELDITQLTKNEKEVVKQQITDYHRYNEIIQSGDFYRLASYSDNKLYDSFMVVSKDKTKALMCYVQVLARPNVRSRKLKLKGLDPEKRYRIDGKRYTGAVLMNIGILLLPAQKDFESKLFVIDEEV